MTTDPLSLITDARHRQVWRQFVRSCRVPKLRSMRQFAEDEIVLPNTGPHRNQRFRCDFQPWTALWLAEVDSGRWHRHVATGPSQSGKTLAAFVLPALYHAFELCEPVVIFAPLMDVLADKWAVDLLPTIQRSRFADLLPRIGAGSQGGFGDMIRFKNGAYFRFMSGGGGDKSKAAVSARVLVATEIDGCDEIRDASREADPITQVLARLRSHGSRARVFLECTASIETGRIWQEFQTGTASRIALRCPHCDHWVSPERADFRGWEHAENELQAEALGQFYCPDCGTAWSAEQRIAANRSPRLVHRGQEITPEGEIVGGMPQTRTLGFRWSAVNNLFATESQLSAEEWKSAREIDRESAEKSRCQFVWAVPFSGESAIADINEKLIASRLSGLPRGVLPDDTETLVATVDIHNRRHYWVVLATGPNSVRSIVDYGIQPTPSPDINGPEAAIRLGLEELRAEFENRRWLTAAGEFHRIDLHTIDAGYMQSVALRFVTEAGPRWRLTKGEGNEFRMPTEDSRGTAAGDHWYLSEQAACEESNGRRWWFTFVETNHWMRIVHNGFMSEAFEEDGKTRRPGSIALFGEDHAVHLAPVDRQVSRSAYATQLVAWRWEGVTTPKRGEVMQWTPAFREDHFFDVTYNALAASSLQQAINVETAEAARHVKVRMQAERRPDGREWL